MVKIVKGERAGKNGKLTVGCSAAVFDENHERILLIRRADNGKWAVPGGYMEAGENFSEACVREVYEETGLQVEVNRLISIYTHPHILLEYPDGNCQRFSGNRQLLLIGLCLSGCHTTTP